MKPQAIVVALTQSRSPPLLVGSKPTLQSFQVDPAPLDGGNGQVDIPPPLDDDELLPELVALPMPPAPPLEALLLLDAPMPPVPPLEALLLLDAPMPPLEALLLPALAALAVPPMPPTPPLEALLLLDAPMPPVPPLEALLLLDAPMPPMPLAEEVVPTVAPPAVPLPEAPARGEAPPVPPAPLMELDWQPALPPRSARRRLRRSAAWRGESIEPRNLLEEEGMRGLFRFPVDAGAQ